MVLRASLRRCFFYALKESDWMDTLKGKQIMVWTFMGNTEEVINRPGIDIPIWMMGGTNEEWLLDGEPKNGNCTEKSMRAWWKLNDMPGETPQNYPERKVSAGRWNDWFFDKNRVPMLRYSSIEGMPHAVLPEQSRRIWTDFFSHLSRQADGDMIYE